MDQKVIFRRGFYLRVALIADLWVYLVSLTLLVTLDIFDPGIENSDLVSFPKWVALFGMVPAFLLFGRLVEKPKVPKNEWAYLITAFYGVVLMAAIVASVLSGQIVVYSGRLLLVSSFVMVGVAGSIGAHILDGGENPIGPRMDERLRNDNE